MGEQRIIPKFMRGWYGVVVLAIAILIVGILMGTLTKPVAAQRPSCDTSGTTVQFLNETCVSSNCTWEYEVCQTGFALSHWVLGLCPCLESRILEVGYVDAEGNATILPGCGEGQKTPCWEFGLDPTTGLSGLKWDNLPGPEDECWTFYVTIDVDLDPATINWTSKFAACAPNIGTVTGPACPCGCGQVIAFKYYDVNKNGAYDEGDYELQGWEICLNGSCETTDEMGFVDFGCLTPGSYNICETLESGWVNSEPGLGSPYCYDVNLEEGDQIRLHFGNYEEDPPKAYIRGSKYYDFNRNGTCDDPNCPLNNWQVCLDGDCQTTRNICMLCGGCTDYWEVTPGTHTLCEIPKYFWVNTDPGVTPPCKEVTVEVGDFSCVPFGNWENPPTVGGDAYPVDKLSLLAPWIALGMAIVVASLIIVRRRRAQS